MRQIPNAITSLNLLCGCLAITQIAGGNFIWAAILVLLGAFFDFFDGMAARILKVSSPIGAELDSLADVVTFGVVPAYLVFSLLNEMAVPPYLAYAAFIIAIFSALRLAKFNVDDRQTESFIGLPTPANALFWISLPLIDWQYTNDIGLISLNQFHEVFFNPWVLLVLVVVFSYLLVAEIPLISLKFKSLSWNKNKNRYLLLLISFALILLFYFAAIPFILLLYFIFSFIENTSSSHEI